MINENNEEKDREFVEKFSSDCDDIKNDCKLSDVLSPDKSIGILLNVREYLTSMQKSVDEQIEKTKERINKKF